MYKCINCIYFLVASLLTIRWKRNLLALTDGAVQIFNTAKDYGKKPAATLHMSGCDGIKRYLNDRAPKKPGVPPNSSAENGFVIKVAGKPHYFVADTVEESE